MLHVIHAGTRAGWSTVDASTSVVVLAPVPPGDSEAAPGSSAPWLGEALADSSSTALSSVRLPSVGSSPGLFEPAFAREFPPVPGATVAPAVAEGVPEGGAEGVAEGDVDGEADAVEPPAPEPEPAPDPPDPPDPPEPPPEPVVGLVGEGLAEPLPPLVGVAVGDGVDEVVGDALGEAVGVGDGVEAATGGATLGGTLVPAVRSCCHDQPTDPPAGTVREPTPEDE
jgi:hypothetical protein